LHPYFLIKVTFPFVFFGQLPFGRISLENVWLEMKLTKRLGFYNIARDIEHDLFKDCTPLMLGLSFRVNPPLLSFCSH